MDALTIGYVGVGFLLVLLLAGVHIGISLMIAGMAGLGAITGFEGAAGSAGEAVYHKIISFELITIPLFVFMGYLASAGGISRKIFSAIQQWVGGIKGGVGMATVCSATAFGTVCGSSLVVSSVFAKLAAPAMREFGYDKKIAYGICASAGMIGMLIPPSVLMVVYGVQSGQSVGKLH
ncbi:MAG: TRAP transporter large permease subunit, partial [Desulfovibrio sp.]|nr:TRAP transporter large permease subunit [Desulfovibrio sp.]